MALFGQETFEKAEATKGLNNPDYQAAGALSCLLAGPGGTDRMLVANDVAALVFPTMPPAWKIDGVNGDQISGRGAGDLSAVAGYPYLTSPIGTCETSAGRPLARPSRLERSPCSWLRLCLRTGGGQFETHADEINRGSRHPEASSESAKTAELTGYAITVSRDDPHGKERWTPH